MSIIKYCLAAFATVSCMVATAQGGVVEREYWLDNNVQSQSLGTSPATLDISSLPAGLHWFTMRVKDDQGIWSPVMTRAFIIPNEIDNTTATSIQRREVWIDSNIVGRQAIGASPVTLDISSLSVGLHTLTMRVQDDLGYWSTTVTKYFIIPEAAVEDDVELVSYCYWFNDNVANMVVGTLPVSGKTVSGVIDIELDFSELSFGQHTIYWIIGDNKGVWGFYTGEINSTTFFNSRGDVNMDGVLSIGDVTALIDYLLSNDDTGIDMVAADSNLDGNVSIGDVTCLIDYLLGGTW